MNRIQSALINIGAGAAIAGGVHAFEQYAIDNWATTSNHSDHTIQVLLQVEGDGLAFYGGLMGASWIRESRAERRQQRQADAEYAAQIIRTNQVLDQAFRDNHIIG